MKQQLKVMLELQESMNTKVHSDWRDQNFEWYRAIWVESAEMLDHYGWKWWKKQSPDIEQVKLELIDIWHFGMSQLLMGSSDIETLAASIDSEMQTEVSAKAFKDELESFVEEVLRTKSFSVTSFLKLMKSIDMGFQELYVGYIGKNVLNFFRQDNGYQSGSYQKQWGGKEDNEHLVEVLATLDSTQENFKESLYSSLQQRYTELCD